jgi:hypothetical protein
VLLYLCELTAKAFIITIYFSPNIKLLASCILTTSQQFPFHIIPDNHLDDQACMSCSWKTSGRWNAKDQNYFLFILFYLTRIMVAECALRATVCLITHCTDFKGKTFFLLFGKALKIIYQKRVIKKKFNSLKGLFRAFAFFITKKKFYPKCI